MKKLMNKKMKFFGKEFSVFAFAAVMMMAVASAALVPYLATEIVEGDVDVDSPLTLVGDFNTVTNNFAIIEKDFSITNNADVGVDAVVDVRMSPTTTTLCDGTNGCDIGDEFMSFTIGNQFAGETECVDDGGTWDNGVSMCFWDVIGDMTVVGGKILVRYGDSDGSTIPALSTGYNVINGKVRMQFQVYAEPDTYGFEAVAVTPGSTLGDGFAALP